MTPTRRRTDTSLLAQISDLLKRYGIFWLPLIWLIGSLGFSLITPKVTVAQLKSVFDSSTTHLQREIDSNRTEARANNATLMAVHSVLTGQIDILLRYDCLDPRMSDRDKQLIRLPCVQLFAPQPKEEPAR